MLWFCSTAKILISTYSKRSFSTSKHSLFNRGHCEIQGKIVLRESGDNLQYFLVSLHRLFLMAAKKALHEYESSPYCFVLCNEGPVSSYPFTGNLLRGQYYGKYYWSWWWFSSFADDRTLGGAGGRPDSWILRGSPWDFDKLKKSAGRNFITFKIRKFKKRKCQVLTQGRNWDRQLFKAP